MSKKILLIAIISIVFALFVDLLFQYAEITGTGIDSPNLQNDYVIGWMTAIGLTGILFLLPFRNEDKNIMLFLWICRCFITLVIMLWYEGTYGLDAYMYHARGQDYRELSQMFQEKTGTNFMLDFIYSLRLIFDSDLSYHALKVVFSFFGLIGIFLFYKGYCIFTEKTDKRLFLLLGLFPSIIFWGSILGKDPIHLLSLGIFFYGFCIFSKYQSIYGFIVMLAGAAFASSIRLWSAPLLVAPLLISFLLSQRSMIQRLVVVSILGFAIFQSADTILEKYKIESLKDFTETTDKVSKSWAFGGASNTIPEFTSPVDILKFLPVGMFTALFRPLPGEILNAFGILASLESLVFLLFAIMIIFQFPKGNQIKGLSFWISGYLIFWSMIYGIISSQNMGSGVRFRLQIIPLFLILWWLSYQQRKPQSQKK